LYWVKNNQCLFMKRNCIFICVRLFVLLCTVCIAQRSFGDSGDASKIFLSVYIPDQVDKMPDAGINILENKLNQIITNNGIAGGVNSRFIITANVVMLTKDITPTSPPMQAYTLEITLYIGDAVDGIKFSSHAITVKGVGENETKAYISALRNINTSDPKYQEFINEGKNKIVNYYKSKCDNIINESKGLSAQNQFDEAILKLVSVPEICKECYDKCIGMCLDVYKAKMEHDCLETIQKSRTLMTQGKFDEASDNLSKMTPDLTCYSGVVEIMNEIYDHKCATAMGQARGAWTNKDIEATSNALKNITTDSKCYQDALGLIDEVRAYVKEKDQKEWDFKLQERKDNIEMAKQEHKDDVEIRKETIQAAREVGVAYSTHQPKVIYNVHGWW